jgi:hypothetical protein
MINIVKKKYAAQLETFENIMVIHKQEKYAFISTIKPCLKFKK